MTDTFSTRAEQMIDAVLDSEKDPNIRESFIWNICKQVPILTLRTLPYLSKQRIRNILTKEVRILTDESIQPFVDIIREMDLENHGLLEIITSMEG